MTRTEAGHPHETGVPSGAQFELTYGDERATVVEVGGGLRSYDVRGRPVLDGYAVDEMCSGGRGQCLAPWPNRLRNGRYRFDGVEHELPRSEPGRPNAIHGLVRWLRWEARSSVEDRAELAVTLFPQPGYPFMLELVNDYHLGPEGLTVRVHARNLGTATCPFAIGFHPYLTVGSPTVDEDVLRIPAETRLLVDDDQIPTGAEPVAGGDHDFREGRRIGAQVLDDGFTALRRDTDGRARVSLTSADGARSVVLWADDAWRFLQAFTGDTLSPGQRRRAVAIEPMTAPANALVSGTDLRVLAPGASFEGTWGITASPR